MAAPRVLKTKLRAVKAALREAETLLRANREVVNLEVSLSFGLVRVVEQQRSRKIVRARFAWVVES